MLFSIDKIRLLTPKKNAATQLSQTIESAAHDLLDHKYKACSEEQIHDFLKHELLLAMHCSSADFKDEATALCEDILKHPAPELPETLRRRTIIEYIRVLNKAGRTKEANALSDKYKGQLDVQDPIKTTQPAAKN